MNKMLFKYSCPLVIGLLFGPIKTSAESPDFSLVGFGSGTTGGEGGSEVTVSSVGDLQSAAGSDGKKIIKIDKTLTGSGTIIEVSSDKTILGVGDKAHLKGIGFHMKNVSNVIIRNLKMTMIGGGAEDIISGETTSSNTGGNYWIDHCEFYNEKPTLPASASKKDKYDGILDFKKRVSNITISWNYIHDHWKCSLIGFSTDKDPSDKKITYHHNWFQNIKSRAPSYRAGTAHIYNNYYEGLTGEGVPTSEGVHSRDGACLYVEGNYFLNYAKSIYWYEIDSPTKAYVNESGVPNKYVNSAPNSAPPCNSFKPSYSAKVDAADDVPAIVQSCAGIGKLDGCVVEKVRRKKMINLSPAFDGATMQLSFPTAEASIIVITNLSGRKMLTRKARSFEVILNMADLNNGVYFLEITYRDKIQRQIFVKK